MPRSLAGTPHGHLQDQSRGRRRRYLGGILGTRVQIAVGFAREVEEAGELHDAIDGVDDPATQVVLRESYADASKAMYLLRLSGDKMSEGELNALGTVQRDGVAYSLIGDVGDLAWSAATAGRKKGGFGLRPAAEFALAVFVASRTASRCGAQRLFKRLEDAGLATESALTQTYDQRTLKAVRRLAEAYGDEPNLVQQFKAVIEAGAISSVRLWEAV